MKFCRLSNKTFLSPMKTIVIKVGTSSICDESTFVPKLSNLSLLVETIVNLREAGHKVVLVSSGAVGSGLRRLGLLKKPKHLSGVQAVAAVGQGKLMALYDQLFSPFSVPIAQILLSRDNLSERSSYLNACSTLKELLVMQVVPIINENDSVTSSEIRFGDNDSLSAIVAGMVSADHLFLLTDVDALYTENPRSNPDAKKITVVNDIAKLRMTINVSSPGSSIGTGGMITKLIAAELSTSTGCTMIITLGSAPQKIISILDEILKMEVDKSYLPTIGTHFVAQQKLEHDRQWWILSGLASSGTLYIDQGILRPPFIPGALKAITRKEKGSLFAAGIKAVSGTFNAFQCVEIVSFVDGQVEGEFIGKGIVNCIKSF